MLLGTRHEANQWANIGRDVVIYLEATGIYVQSSILKPITQAERLALTKLNETYTKHYAIDRRI